MRDGTVQERINYITKEYEQRKALRDHATKEQKPDIIKQEQKPEQKPDTGYNHKMGI